MHPVHNTRSRCHQVQVVLALQTLFYDFQVQKPQETAAESKAQGNGCLRLVEQGGIVELRLSSASLKSL